MKEKTFLFHRSFLEASRILELKDRYLFFEAIIEYGLYGKTNISLAGIGKGLLILAKATIDMRNIGKGEEHWNRKGGITDRNKMVRNSKEYRLWRYKVFERDSYICQECGQKGGELDAHHIVPFSVDERKRLDVGNGLTLCKGCHRLKHKFYFSKNND